jgi:aldehyde:ferredoxin oxidoreductase
MKAKGYWGRILRVDLSRKKATEQPLDDRVASAFIGGSGLGARILFDEVPPEADPLGPDNLLIFAVGPLTGTRIYNSNRFDVVAKSPLTGIFAEANSGGFWGETFKKCGYDALIIQGISKRPVFLSIDEKGTRIEEAGELWGKETFEVERLLREKYGQNAQAAVIGPAGERMVRIANITTDGKHARAIGRCGMGAVMGSKKLKAIVVNGNKEPEIAYPEKVQELMRALAATMKEGTVGLKQYGTSGGMEYCEEIGNIPVKNWYQGPWPEGAKKISGRTMAASILTNRYHCGRCVINCGRVVKSVEGPYKGLEIGGPEYETLGLLGSNLLIDDLQAVATLNELCNRYGLDTISTGGVIGFAMEAYERGLVSTKDMDGIDLRWGNAKAAQEMIEAIAFRKGFGEVLGGGVKRAAEQLGGVAAEFAVHVKGLEPPAHDPRAKVTVAIGFATSNRGACHLQGFTHDFEEGAFIADLGLPQLKDRFSLEGKVENVIRMQHLMCMFDSLTCCKFGLFGGLTVQPLTRFLNHVTGWDFDADRFFKTGERMFNLKRLYNVRAGISRKDDMLPPRMAIHKRGGGTNFLPPINSLLNEYYRLRGWDEFGIPTPEKRRELGI